MYTYNFKNNDPGSNFTTDASWVVLKSSGIPRNSKLAYGSYLIKIAAMNQYYSSLNDSNLRGKVSYPAFPFEYILFVAPNPPVITGCTTPGTSHNISINFQDSGNTSSGVTNYEYTFNTSSILPLTATWYKVVTPLISPATSGSIAAGTEALSNLLNGIPYFASLRAINNIGTSEPFTYTLTAFTLTEPPAAPIISDISNVGDRKALITFVRPNDGGSPLISYTYFIATKGYSIKLLLNPSYNIDTSTSFYIDVSQNGVSYDISMNASNYWGPSVKSNMRSIITGFAPGAPGISAASIVEGSPNTFIITYTPAPNNGFDIQHYYYSCTLSSVTTPNWIEVFSSPITTPNNIANNTIYNIKMYAANIMGGGTIASVPKTLSLDPQVATISDVVISNQKVTMTITPGNTNGKVVRYWYTYLNSKVTPSVWSTAVEITPMTNPKTIIIVGTTAFPMPNGYIQTIIIRSSYVNEFGTTVNIDASCQATPATTPGSAAVQNTITNGNACATISFTTPNTGGLPTRYYYTYTLDALNTTIFNAANPGFTRPTLDAADTTKLPALATTSFWTKCPQHSPVTPAAPATQPTINYLTTIILSGLTNGVKYTSLKVMPINDVGVGTSTILLIATPYTNPTAPFITKATRVQNPTTLVYAKSATIDINDPTENGGYPIFGYEHNAVNNDTAKSTTTFGDSAYTIISGSSALAIKVAGYTYPEGKSKLIANTIASTTSTMTYKTRAYFYIPGTTTPKVLSDWSNEVTM